MASDQPYLNIRQIRQRHCAGMGPPVRPGAGVAELVTYSFGGSVDCYTPFPLGVTLVSSMPSRMRESSTAPPQRGEASWIGSSVASRTG